MNRIAALAVLFAVLLVARAGGAHPLHFGSLVIRAEGLQRYAIAFRYSGTEDRPGDATVRLPSDCHDIGSARESTDSLGVSRSVRVRCATPLEGRVVSVSLNGSDLQVLATFESADGAVQREMLSSAHAEITVGGAANTPRGARRFFVLGIEHIATGLDHLAFVLALLVLVRGRRRLVGTITSFTLGHSMTLAAAALGAIHFPSAPTEALIALSILLVATEITHPERDTLARRSPWLVAGLFGLVHGLGFAGALTTAGLSRREIPLALAAFNLGVEVGQLAFVAVVFAIAALTRLHRDSIRRDRSVAYVLGAFGAYLAFDRVYTMLR